MVAEASVLKRLVGIHDKVAIGTCIFFDQHQTLVLGSLFFAGTSGSEFQIMLSSGWSESACGLSLWYIRFRRKKVTGTLQGHAAQELDMNAQHC
jgi:hypothetical protein